jgi:hypothetical protein
MITELKPNEIIVVGTNMLGNHYGGAAKQAYDNFGALWGEGFGSLGGQSYGIVTLNESMQKVSIGYIEQQAVKLRIIAGSNLNKRFLLTPVGTGIAGFTYEEIKPLFEDLPGNIIKVGWDE